MLFSLLDEVHATECAFVCHLLGLDVFRGEEKLFGVKEKHAGFTARLDHFVCFLERYAEGLFADDVFARVRCIDSHPRVQAVRRGDGNHLDILVLQQVAIIGIVRWNAVAARECLGVPGCR